MSKKSWGDKRGLFVKVKTARGRKSSSTKWLQRQLNDPYVVLAREEGYRSRAAYKLLEIDDKFKFLKKGKKLVDLGSTPGGWTQVAVKKLGEGNVIALDINEMEEVEGSIFIQEDFTEDAALEKLDAALEGAKIDIVVSDMAASSCGHTQTDHIRIMMLCELALDFALQNLAKNGIFIAKILRGGAEKELQDQMNKSFATVKYFKPDASRKDSSEMYVVAQGFRGDTK